MREVTYGGPTIRVRGAEELYPFLERAGFTDLTETQPGTLRRSDGTEIVYLGPGSFLVRAEGQGLDNFERTYDVYRRAFIAGGFASAFSD